MLEQVARRVGTTAALGAGVCGKKLAECTPEGAGDVQVRFLRAGLERSGGWGA